MGGRRGERGVAFDTFRMAKHGFPRSVKKWRENTVAWSKRGRRLKTAGGEGKKGTKL